MAPLPRLDEKSRSALPAARCVLSALFLSSAVAAAGLAAEAGTEPTLVGGEFSYTVRPGDSLTLIGARFGVAPGVLARTNNLGTGDRLRIGQLLRIDNRHVVPFLLENGILINVPQRLLFLFRDGRLVSWYPVGLGRRKWETTLGQFEVRVRERSPVWHVPASIREEMRQRGQPVRTRVAPGPDNPLGDYWIGLTESRCGIHGTNAPASIYQFQTHGCIRLHPDDIADLFPRVALGTRVWIVDEPLLLAQAVDGAVYLEFNPSTGQGPSDPAARVAALAERQKLQELLDAVEVERVVGAKEGIARRVGPAR
jgi:L,D-transpeptidase ErfK/SrfK